MKFFRSHIARMSGFIMLMLGIALHYANPQDSKADHSAFTNWLESHLKTPDENVLDRLDELSSQESDLDSVIREASELVTTYRDDFELPASQEDASEEENYQVLLTEWKNYQTSGSGMGKAVLIQNIKPQTILPSDGHFLASALNKRSIGHQEPELSELYTQELSSGNSYILSPFKSGTAINAP
jgi:hypothetical protein